MLADMLLLMLLDALADMLLLMLPDILPADVLPLMLPAEVLPLMLPAELDDALAADDDVLAAEELDDALAADELEELAALLLFAPLPPWPPQPASISSSAIATIANALFRLIGIWSNGWRPEKAGYPFLTVSDCCMVIGRVLIASEGNSDQLITRRAVTEFPRVPCRVM